MSEQTAGPGRTTLDPDAIQRLLQSTGGDAEFVVMLLETFAADAPATLDALRRGLASGDGAAVGRAAHTLKSNARTFGASELAELCSDLERRAASGDDMGADGERLRRIETAYAAVEPALAKLQAELA